MPLAGDLRLKNGRPGRCLMESTVWFGKIAGMALTATAVTATATALTANPAWATGHRVFMPGVPPAG